jgi:hypothetical protein
MIEEVCSEKFSTLLSRQSGDQKKLKEAGVRKLPKTCAFS